MLRTTHRTKRHHLLPAHLLPRVRTDDSPLVVWRTWLVAPDHRHKGPAVAMLTGLMGFPWRKAELDAKCTIQDPNRTATAFARPTMDRHHPKIPDPDCTCGVYARRDALDVPPTSLVPRGIPIAAGFVELSGHVLQDDENSRASHARIVGPLHLLPGRMPLVDSVLQLKGAKRTPTKVAVDKGAYRVGWSHTSGGTPFSKWRREVACQLRDRYDVEIA